MLTNRFIVSLKIKKKHFYTLTFVYLCVFNYIITRIFLKIITAQKTVKNALLLCFNHNLKYALPMQYQFMYVSSIKYFNGFKFNFCFSKHAIVVKIDLEI